ncbi:hypothetical protein HDV03_005159 [Kappamyces sp. JEL0829]|nr:hypothetical protein HDV03_005159 [Kappamyces sp. JEL0829]
MCPPAPYGTGLMAEATTILHDKVRLITRYGKFKGYGFVSLKTKADVEQLCSSWNGKEVGSREIKVQPAEPPKPAAPAAERATPGDAPAKARKPRNRKPKQKRVDDAAATTAPPGSSVPEKAKEDVPEDADKKKKRTRKPKPKTPKTNGAPVPEGESEKKPENTAAPKPEKAAKKRTPIKPAADEVISDTTLFIGNLPFHVDEVDLKDLFGEFKPVSARIVKRPFSKNPKNVRSKGYGFVVFSDAASRARAIDDFEGATLEGRELIIKKAFEQPKEEVLV